MVNVSVIVTTYNWPEALKLVLNSLSKQTYKHFEVIVADDGSNNQTVEMLDVLKNSLPYPLVHVWHEDSGFRAAAIRNRASSNSKGELLIFLDGDCIPFPNFIEKHLKFAEKGFYSSGNRILLTKDFTRKIILKNSPIYNWRKTRWVAHWLLRNINRIMPLVCLPNWKFRKFLSHKWRGVRTCNMACWRDDFFNVNGFDEKYQGWGREDSDLAIRLINSDVFRKDVRYAIPVLHLWHKENDRGKLEENDCLLNEVIQTGRTIALDGMNK